MITRPRIYSLEFNIRVAEELIGETAVWIAECRQFALCSQAENPFEALRSLATIIEHQNILDNRSDEAQTLIMKSTIADGNT